MFDNTSLEQFLKVAAIVVFIFVIAFCVIRPIKDEDEDDQDRFDPPAIKLG